MFSPYTLTPSAQIRNWCVPFDSNPISLDFPDWIFWSKVGKQWW